MIFKKPYAFFIKFFKFFHLIIFLLSSILLYRTSLVYNFMMEYCKSNPNVIGKNLTSTLFVWWVYLLIFIILAVNILIIIVLIRKVKPYMYYIFNIGLYIFVAVVFIVSHRVIGNMQTMLVATKTTLAIRDFLNLARLFQTVSVVFYLIRSTGFDIKKFDFVRDLHGMDISEEDSEEIEVSVEFEGNVFIRNIRKELRNIRYYYKENKFIINIFSMLFLSFIFLFIYFSFNKYDKVYNENSFFSVGGYNIGVKSSSILSTDFMGNKIVSDDSVLVVIKFSVKGLEPLSSSKFVLVVNGMQYYPVSGYDSYLTDLGIVYNNQLINNEFSDYLFVYSIPKDSAESSMIFRCIDSINFKRGNTIVNSIDVKLDPINYDNADIKTYEYGLNNVIDIDDYKVNIVDYDISKSFVVNYNSCILPNECYDFKEVLLPSLMRNREKVLLKLNGSVSNSIGNLNMYKFIKNYGSIDYVYIGNNYTEISDFNVVVSSKSSLSNVYYIEVDKEIMDASSIKFNFNFRDRKYSYILRGDSNE